jgi:hypothetical protein
MRPAITPGKRQGRPGAAVAQALGSGYGPALPALAGRTNAQIKGELLTLTCARRGGDERGQRLVGEAPLDRQELVSRQRPPQRRALGRLELGLIDGGELDAGVRAAQHSEDEVLQAHRDPEAKADPTRASHQAESDEGLTAHQPLELTPQQSVQTAEELRRRAGCRGCGHRVRLSGEGPQPGAQLEREQDADERHDDGDDRRGDLHHMIEKREQPGHRRLR